MGTKMAYWGPGTTIASTAAMKMTIVLTAATIPALPGWQWMPSILHSSAEKAVNMKALKRKAMGRKIRITIRQKRRKWYRVRKHTIPVTKSRDADRRRALNTPKTRAAVNAPLKLESAE